MKIGQCEQIVCDVHLETCWFVAVVVADLTCDVTSFGASYLFIAPHSMCIVHVSTGAGVQAIDGVLHGHRGVEAAA